ncbi:MAG: peptidoglycan-binding protein [Candidatus Kaiserbacteria bacterium]|nr:peptidoglycan-binding protein [Candidatus Kaiserbacteria bacterium]
MLYVTVLFVALAVHTVPYIEADTSMEAKCAEILADETTRPGELKREMEKCQEYMEHRVKVGEEKLNQQQADRLNTEQEIAVIDKEINRVLSNIQTIDDIIGDLGEEIIDKETAVEGLGEKVEDRKLFLTTLFRNLNETEQRGFVSLLLSNTTLSSYFFEENEYRSLRKVTEESVNDINGLRHRIAASIEELREKKDEQGRIRQHQEVSAQRVQEKREEKDQVLKGQIAEENDTKEYLEEYRERAAKIRNRLFDLFGGGAISFEQALTYANEVHAATGIRPAFLLGVIKHESDLGKNVGTGTYQKDMHPTRDQPLFPKIVKLLGYDDPNELRVSARPGFGWGGAMGPAQFIPSTWVCYGGMVNRETGTCSMTSTSRVIRGNTTLQIGSSGSDVKRLQRFLNRQGFTVASIGPGSPGNETGTYGSAVAQAVTRFQERYASRILRPYNLTRGTGQVGPSTRSAVNQINFYDGSWEYRRDKDIVRRHTGGNRPSNPWNPRDAFFVSGIYLTELGALKNECTASRRYYAGSNWQSRVARLYCDGVLAKARDFEKDIAFLRR